MPKVCSPLSLIRHFLTEHVWERTYQWLHYWGTYAPILTTHNYNSTSGRDGPHLSSTRDRILVGPMLYWSCVEILSYSEFMRARLLSRRHRFTSLLSSSVCYSFSTSSSVIFLKWYKGPAFHYDLFWTHWPVMSFSLVPVCSPTEGWGTFSFFGSNMGSPLEVKKCTSSCILGLLTMSDHQ